MSSRGYASGANKHANGSTPQIRALRSPYLFDSRQVATCRCFLFRSTLSAFCQLLVYCCATGFAGLYSFAPCLHRETSRD